MRSDHSSSGLPRRPRVRSMVLAAAALTSALAIGVLASAGSRTLARATLRTRRPAATVAAPASAVVAKRLPRVEITLLAQRPPVRIPRSFLGLSTEYWTLPVYEREPDLFERVLSLVTIRGDGPLVLRIGGDSSDHVLWDPRVRDLPRWAFGLTPQWLRGARAVVRATQLRLILDLNILTGSPQQAAAWAHAADVALPRRSIMGFAIGNEDDIYDRLYWLSFGTGKRVGIPLLPDFFTTARYIEDFADYADALRRAAPGVPLIGPEVAEPSAHLDWISELLRAAPSRLSVISAHRYPYSACVARRSAAYPTVARLLGEGAAEGLARSVGGAVRVAHRAGRPFRLTELNSVTCGGLSGISDTFATALWAPDAIFDLLAAGVDGVNIHTRAYAINAPFALSSRGLLARPLLYGLVFAARSLSPGGELLRVRVRADRDLHTRAWVVRVRSGALHVVLLDKGQRAVAVALRIPGRGPAEVQRLLAPSVRSRSHVTLAGQHLGRDGSWWGQPRIDLIGRGRDGYAIKLPPFSAALVIVHGARRGA